MSEKAKILVVDDQPDFREIFSVELGSKGYDVLTASGGDEGIAIAKQSRPDLILMDVQMPNMTGVETLLKIKADPDIKDMKVVFLTNLGNEDAESAMINDLTAKDIHAAGYIKKTEDMNVLLADIERYLAA